MIVRLAALDEVFDRVAPLLRAHWQEIAHHKHLAKLAPDWDHYRLSEQNGTFFTVIAEDGAALVGYNAYFLVKMVHNVPIILARNDVLYIVPGHRGRGLLRQLMRLGEAEAYRRGASLVSMHIKPELDFGPIIEREGYRLDEYVRMKELR